MLPPHMDFPDPNPKRDSPQRDFPSADGDPIPARRHHPKPARNPAIPPQPTSKTLVIRLAVATAIGIAVMFALLMLATQYLQRDWTQKEQKARARPPAPAKAAELESAASPGWKYELRPTATDRQLERLRTDRFSAGGWFILSRGLSSKTDPRILMAGLRMALASAGESAEVLNEMGALLLRQNRMKGADAQFQAALQISPGFPPARFNLALCRIEERNPAQAVQLLGQYLGQRPADVVALRLQSKLLTQLEQPLDALHMLEKFLKDQPPEQPLFLEAALLAARLGQNGKALRYLETAIKGNPIQAVVRAYQSPVFREIRLSGEGDALASRMAAQARVAFGAPLPVEEFEPLRAPSPTARPVDPASYWTPRIP